MPLFDSVRLGWLRTTRSPNILQARYVSIMMLEGSTLVRGVHAWKYSTKYKYHGEEYEDGNVDPTDSFDVIKIECCIAKPSVSPWSSSPGGQNRGRYVGCSRYSVGRLGLRRFALDRKVCKIARCFSQRIIVGALLGNASCAVQNNDMIRMTESVNWPWLTIAGGDLAFFLVSSPRLVTRITVAPSFFNKPPSPNIRLKRSSSVSLSNPARTSSKSNTISLEYNALASA